ncbi:uncharacterized protein LOC6566516 [Drosophila grimshawi]|uniref:GH13428 n=1 Tax=Drosophila grimshawi TaxID=7222 RepID=B4JPD0_DROGR|nr:uncharacterized protein LOC6566516 [Drosophila grimshawi]EDV98760.1 GH13428 [Drosophila grimshawi]
MGAKATKMDANYVPNIPKINRAAAPIELSLSPCRENNEILLDPRSPNGCRTPLNLPPLMPLATAAVAAPTENTFAQLRKRLLRGFSLQDPRSPQLNRTPLVLDAAIDRTLNMDDTFADLFVETRAPQPAIPSAGDQQPANESVEIVSLTYEEDETMPCCDMLVQQTPEPASVPAPCYDPRSPSVGVERTPIIFCDDADEAEERDTQMLEEILETLTLNLSAESSMASFVSASAELTQDELQLQPAQSLSQSRPANKHLERVRLGNKRRVAPRKPARANKTRIYVDALDSHTSSTPKSSTPKSSTPNPAQRSSQRTPLSSVNRNRVHLRSRSVEKDLVKPSLQLPLQSFDDQLNPGERLNVPSLRRLLASENRLEP